MLQRSLFPASVMDLDDAVEIKAGASHTCARRTGGEVVCWGDNSYGQLGAGDTVPHRTLMSVIGLENIVEIAAGVHHTCARNATRQVFCWGRNDRRQLGDGTTVPRPMPVPVMDLGDAIQLSAGSTHNCALREANREVVCWGDNSTGRLGDGTQVTSRATLVSVKDLFNVAEVSVALEYSCALRRSGDNGDVTCWGRNAGSMLGDGTTMDSLIPKTTVSSLTDAARIVTGAVHACALRTDRSTDGSTDGSLVCWGKNASGQLGDGTMTDRMVPVQVSGF